MEQRNLIRRPVRRVDISINMEKTGANIRRLIKASGYSVRDIMAITGISTEQAVYKWYRGESIPAIETMLILTSALGVDIKELLVIDGEFDFYHGIIARNSLYLIKITQYSPYIVLQYYVGRSRRRIRREPSVLYEQ